MEFKMWRGIFTVCVDKNPIFTGRQVFAMYLVSVYKTFLKAEVCQDILKF